jgi:hypothetical protein
MIGDRLCMSCHNMQGGCSKKKMIAIISGAGIAATGIAYVSLAANPIAAALIPAVLAFTACPAMCAAMGGVMWLSRRFSKRKNQTQVQQSVVNSKEEAEEVKTQRHQPAYVVYQQQQLKNKTASQDIYLQLVISLLAYWILSFQLLIKLVATYPRKVWYTYNLDVAINNGSWN